MNLSQYASKVFHVPMSELPLNHVDLCLLNELAYLPVDEIAEHHGGFARGVSAAQILQEFQAEPGLRANWFLATGNRINLLRAVAASPRFAGLRFYHYEARLDLAEQVQFAALTAILPGVFRQVIFRGTDDSLVGWKEDFRLALQPAIMAQTLAAEYLEANLAQKAQTPLFVTGHSKGGNLAIYAASQVSAEARAGITEVLAFDAPGFSPAFLEREGYQAVRPLLSEYIPQDSIVGRCLGRAVTPTVVRSGAVGLIQHSIFTWQADAGGRFITEEAPSPTSDRVDRVTDAWVSQHSPEDIQAVVDILFDLALTEGYASLLDIGQNLVLFIQMMRAKTSELDPDSAALVQGLLDDFLALWRADKAEQKELTKKEPTPRLADLLSLPGAATARPSQSLRERARELPQQFPVRRRRS